jgi:phosphate transport system substrate-binding protein
MSTEDIEAAGAPVLHIPICAGAVVLTYNLPGNPEVKFTPDVISEIFLERSKNGMITG